MLFLSKRSGSKFKAANADSGIAEKAIIMQRIIAVIL